MSVYSGSIASAAGSMISVLDTELVKNSNWSIYDASAGTNAKTYECKNEDNDVLFYLNVQDNQSDYSIVQMWEGWNATSHAGTGARTGTVYWRHDVGSYYILLHNYDFIYIHYTTSTTYRVNWAGRMTEIQTGERYYSLIGHPEYYLNTANSCAGPGSYSSWRLLKDQTGAPNLSLNIFQGGGWMTNNYILDDNDVAHLFLPFVFYTQIVFAYIEYFIPLGFPSLLEFAGGDIITVESEDWKVCQYGTGSGSSSFCLVRWI